MLVLTITNIIKYSSEPSLWAQPHLWWGDKETLPVREGVRLGPKRYNPLTGRIERSSTVQLHQSLTVVERNFLVLPLA